MQTNAPTKTSAVSFRRGKHSPLCPPSPSGCCWPLVGSGEGFFVSRPTGWPNHNIKQRKERRQPINPQVGWHRCYHLRGYSQTACSRSACSGTIHAPPFSPGWTSHSVYCPYNEMGLFPSTIQILEDNLNTKLTPHAPRCNFAHRKWHQLEPSFLSTCMQLPQNVKNYHRDHVQDQNLLSNFTISQ